MTSVVRLDTSHDNSTPIMEAVSGSQSAVFSLNASNSGGPAHNSSPHPPFRHRSHSGTNLLSKLPFVRSTSDDNTAAYDRNQRGHVDDKENSKPKIQRHSSMGAAEDTTKQSRKRRGSLRKVALLGRGVQNEASMPPPPLPSSSTMSLPPSPPKSLSSSPPSLATEPTYPVTIQNAIKPTDFNKQFSQSPTAVDDNKSLANNGAFARSRLVSIASAIPLQHATIDNTRLEQAGRDRLEVAPVVSYTSTTDEEDILHIPKHTSASLASGTSSSQPSGAGSYMTARIRRKSIHRAKSPLSHTGLPNPSSPTQDSEWDYSETEWWGWVVLIVTWVVFVIGMGSCLGVWSWAWDVGKTPYAPPELENDPSLPMIGYYPALIILSCIMAWVWVVVAWIGMKYFRHAKISGD